ncbi:putative 3-methyladenine DNA glycosylase [Mycolicibacterium confluentis]|uniref:Putative 3-methyladenine DNA glycosylase n=1 Tax=Mycolicibacterium confluentis TaxID=28047 RepID=A0A7I7XVR9_9MYCO|nr:putative 3-methyladenine DNA glycosylase [Mycolicibacterium confluentis]
MSAVNVQALASDPQTAARLLVGATLWGRDAAALIVEVEAYGGTPDGPWPDPAAHSYRGPTVRNDVMFGPAGRLYTYRSHGIHVCANVSCGPDGTAAAVLLRAGLITEGVEVARTRRGPVADRALGRGPGNLCSALGILLSDNGIDLLDPSSPVRLELGSAPEVVAGPRVGVSSAADRPWRYWLAGHPEVSAYRRSPRAPTHGLSD